MRLNELKDKPGARKARVRVGRGPGSGKGKTAGRGHKGAKARSGTVIGSYEGGQMPIYMRLPKRGFKAPFSKEYAELNIGRLQQAIDAGKLDAGKRIDEAALRAAGVVGKARHGVRLLGKGDLTAKLDLELAGASKAAKAAVEKAGGSLTLTADGKAPKPTSSQADS